MGYDDKPKKLPTRQPMWMQNNTAPASTTATYQPAPVPQRTIADNAPVPTYLDKYGTSHKNYAGGDPYSYDSRRYNGKVIRNMENQKEWDAAKNIGAFGLSVLSDPIALGMSVFDFAKDPSLSNAAFLGLDAFTPGNLGGLFKVLGTTAGLAGAGRLFQRGAGKLKNMFRLDDVVPEFKAISGNNYASVLEDEAATNTFLNAMSSGDNISGGHNTHYVWDARDAIRRINGINNNFVPTPTSLVPIGVPDREHLINFIDARNEIKSQFIDAIENSRPHNRGLMSTENLPDINYVDGTFGNIITNIGSDYDRIRGDFLQYYDDEIRNIIKDTFGIRGQSADSLMPKFMEEQTWSIYRDMLHTRGDNPINAVFNNPNNITRYGSVLEQRLAQTRADRLAREQADLQARGMRHFTPPSWANSSSGGNTFNNTPASFFFNNPNNITQLNNIPTLGVQGPTSLLGRTPEINFANRYAELFNEHLRKRGINDHFITANMWGNGMATQLHRFDKPNVGSWSMGLNDLASNKVKSGDFSIPDFPRNAVDPYKEIPVLTMSNTSGANLPPKAGLYSQEFMDAIKNEFGIRVGAGRNSQTRNSQYNYDTQKKLGSEDIWKNKFNHGFAYVPDGGVNGFTKAISYALLPPFLLRALQREQNDDTRQNTWR